MTKEDKELLLRDLCARLPYGIRVWYKYATWNKPWFCTSVDVSNETVWLGCKIDKSDTKEPIIEAGEILIKPYLRPMSSMTDEEVDYDLEEATTLKGLNAEVEYNPDTCRIQTAEYVIGTDIRFGEHTDEYPPIDHHDMYKTIDWLNEHHFDYRGLIEKGLALEAPEGMY